jgi:hypothetical protein
MTPWITSLITLAAVAIGAILSFLTTRLNDRDRWRREEGLRWDTQRLHAYSDFATAMLEFSDIAFRITAGLGFPVVAVPLGTKIGLPALAAAGTKLNMQWQKVLLLGSPDTVLAARDWQDEVFHLEYFARKLRQDPAEFAQATVDRRKARGHFYSVARADLMITSGDLPAQIHALGKWRTLTEAQPQAPRGTRRESA